MSELNFLHAIKLSESISLSDIHLSKLRVLKNLIISGIKCGSVSINLNDPARDARHLKRYVFGQELFVQSKFLFSFDPYKFLSFLCKAKQSCKIYFVLQNCVCFRFDFFFHDR